MFIGGEIDDILRKIDYTIHVILKVLISIKFNNYHHGSVREGTLDFKLNVYSHIHIHSKIRYF